MVPSRKLVKNSEINDSCRLYEHLKVEVSMLTYIFGTLRELISSKKTFPRH